MELDSAFVLIGCGEFELSTLSVGCSDDDGG